MKNYQSVEFKVLQSIFSETKVEENIVRIPQKLGEIILEFCSFSDEFKTFISELSSGIAIDKLDEVLNKYFVLSENNLCHKCIDCKKCNNLFYLALADKFITLDNKYNHDVLLRWAKRKETYQKKYGLYNFNLIPSNIAKHLVQKESISGYYSEKRKRIVETRDIKDSLIILKGMSSSSPYLYNSVLKNEHFTGGGIYINYCGVGIVIDPGFGFVENMQKNNIFISDIDFIFITHFHIDHTNDIRLLDDLNRNINHGIKDFSNEADYSKFKKEKLEGKDIHKIIWYVDSDTSKNLLKDFNPLINEINIISDFSETLILNEKLSINVFHTKHVEEYFYDKDEIKRNFKSNTFGLVLKIKSSDDNIKKIAYTSDTAYTHEITSALTGSHCIIANISGIYEDDYLDIKHKDRHLGYSGCKALLENIKPDIFVLSEFWNGMTDLRFDVCKDLDRKSNTVLPGEVGLQIQIPSFSVRCSICGNYKNLDEIKVISPHKEMKDILFVCEDCMY